MPFSGDTPFDDVDCLWEDANFYWDSNADLPEILGKALPPHLLTSKQDGE